MLIKQKVISVSQQGGGEEGKEKEEQADARLPGKNEKHSLQKVRYCIRVSKKLSISGIFFSKT